MRWALPQAGLLLVEQSGRPGTGISKPVLRLMLFVAQCYFYHAAEKNPAKVIHKLFTGAGRGIRTGRDL
jgi:hypothetical protein